MVTKEQFFRKWTGLADNYSSVMLLGVTADRVVNAVNSLCKDWRTDKVACGKEYEKRGIKVVEFRVYGETPKILFPLTRKLGCKGYADTQSGAFIKKGEKRNEEH